MNYNGDTAQTSDEASEDHLIQRSSVVDAAAMMRKAVAKGYITPSKDYANGFAPGA